jgi:heme exporter protein A
LLTGLSLPHIISTLNNVCADTVSLVAEDIERRFGYRRVLDGINFSLTSPAGLGIIGPNGSGKTTLLNIIAGLLPPSAGKLTVSSNGMQLSRSAACEITGMVAPDLSVYSELTAIENLVFYARVAGIEADAARIDRLLERAGLAQRRSDVVGVFSSGMKQRLKFLVALLKSPRILLLDEPGTNLDDAGRELIADIMTEQAANHILVVTTNDTSEVESMGNVLELDR